MAKRDRLIYEYDFGDSWRHQVVLEKILPGVPAAKLSCAAGARAGPPEDCGGPPGYADLVAAMADPAHPEKPGLIRWLGGPHDPEAFSLEDANAQLGLLRT